MSLNKNNAVLAVNADDKLNASVFTTTPSQNVFKKKLSLNSCSSSISISEADQPHAYLQERKLFMKFLFQRDSNFQRDKILQKMRAFYSQKMKEKNLQQTCISNADSLELPLRFQPILKPMLVFYAGIWLKTMGYRSKQNKHLVLSHVKLTLPIEILSKAAAFYENFGNGFLSPSQRWDLIEQTCLNGWEYFSNVLQQQVKKLVVLD